MNSRQRILNSIRREPVDHVPLWMRFWKLGEVNTLPIPWQDQVRRAEYLLALGMDDVLMLEPPLGYVENYQPELLVGVTSRVWVEEKDGKPILIKTYQTASGELRQAVWKTEDWERGENIYMFDDFNIPRMVEALIKDTDDLKILPALLAEPDSSQLAAYRQSVSTLRNQADKLGVAVEGGMTALGDSAIWLCGMQRVLMAQMDEPEFLEELLDILLAWELRRVDILLDQGADMITHMAWYEGTDFWTPRNYRRLLKPRLKQLVDRTHARGAVFRYIITKGWKPLMQDLLDLEIDCLAGVDPVQGGADLAVAKQTLGEKMCLMGGINSAVSLLQWTEEEIRRAVDEAFHILSPGGGFILYPVDAIFSNFPWDKVLVVIDQWKKNFS